MNKNSSSPRWFVIVSPAGPEVPPYTLAMAAQLAAVHPDLLRHYCRIGLLGPAHTSPEPAPVFDDNSLYAVRRIQHFRQDHGVSLHALRLVCGLLREIEQLRGEVRFLRDR